MDRKIIFDYYLDGTFLDHISIKPFIKKIVTIPYSVRLQSNNGFYIASEENKEERRMFFDLMCQYFMISGGRDILVDHDQFIPFLCYFEKFRPNNYIVNIGLLSTLHLIQKMAQLGDSLQIFIGIDLKTYNYLNTDIYYDCLYSENLEIKKNAFIVIRKYCNLYFLITFLISSNLKRNMDKTYYFEKFLTVLKIISGKFVDNVFINRLLKQSRNFYDNETDIFRMTAFKYAPRYLPITKINEFHKIFNLIKPDNIRDKIYQIHKREENENKIEKRKENDGV